ncbi:hypothetical protein LXL04_003306 [Taraxacum kok-saghyz]
MHMLELPCKHHVPPPYATQLHEQERGNPREREVDGKERSSAGGGGQKGMSDRKKKVEERLHFQKIEETAREIKVKMLAFINVLMFVDGWRSDDDGDCRLYMETPRKMEMTRKTATHSEIIRSNHLPGMDLHPPFLMTFYHGGNIKYEDGAIKKDISTSSFMIPASHNIRYEEFVNLIYEHVGVDKRMFKMNITLHFEVCGKPNSAPIFSDKTLDLMFYLAKQDPHYCAQIHVETISIPLSELLEKWSLDDIRDYILHLFNLMN